MSKKIRNHIARTPGDIIFETCLYIFFILFMASLS